MPTWEHLASPATSFQTLPGGPQKLHLNPSFSQFSPCPTRCAVCPSVCRFHSYCCLPVPADPVFCATRSLPYPLALHVFLVAHHVCLCPAWMYGAPELPCIVNSIRVAAMLLVGFFGLLHLGELVQPDTSSAKHWFLHRPTGHVQTFFCCTALYNGEVFYRSSEGWLKSGIDVLVVVKQYSKSVLECNWSVPT